MNDKQQLATLNRAIADLKRTKEGYTTHPNGPAWTAAFKSLNALKADLVPKPSRVPNLGPIVKGEKSLLLHDCTHITSNVGWPAFDEMADPGSIVVAPEPCIVYDNTSGATGGDAFYFRGASGMLYWIGHITTVPARNTKFAKGAKMTTVSRDHPRPHAHLGINAIPLIGHHFISHDDYSHGAPKIGVQLTRALDS